jgi:rod shape-determining protein MreD
MLRTILIFLILSVTGIYLQSSFIPRVFPFDIAPDFILILVIWVALRNEERAALLGSFFLGLLSDFASGIYLGPQALGAVLACALVQGFSRHVYADKFLSIAVVTSCASLIKQLSSRLLVLSFTGFNSIHDFGIYILIGQSLLTALFAPVVIQLIFVPRRRKTP